VNVGSAFCRPAHPPLIAAKKKSFVFNGCHPVTAGFCSATRIGFTLCFQWLPYGNPSSFTATSPGVTCLPFSRCRRRRSGVTKDGSGTERSYSRKLDA
jgi:hypothetical protein